MLKEITGAAGIETPSLGTARDESDTDNHFGAFSAGISTGLPATIKNINFRITRWR